MSKWARIMATVFFCIMPLASQLDKKEDVIPFLGLCLLGSIAWSLFSIAVTLAEKK